MVIELYFIRKGIKHKLQGDIPLQPGDLLSLSVAPDISVYTRSELVKSNLVIILFSPLGTIVDIDKIDLELLGFDEFYTYKVPADLFSGVYMLTIKSKGGVNERAKIVVKTNRNLVNHYVFNYNLDIENPNSYPINEFVIDVIIPPNISNFQQIREINYNMRPVKLLQDKEGNKWVRFIFPQIYAREKITLGYQALITTRVVGYDVTRIINLEKDPLEAENDNPELYLRYTQPEPFLESDSKEIEKIIRKIKAEGNIRKAISILKYVRTNLHYQQVNGDFGTKYALTHGIGDCTEFATLFVSLCRGAGIPSRLATSIIKTGNIWEKHSHAEFFARGIWWQIDPTFQIDTKYLIRKPEIIVLLRGNSLNKNHIKEVRYTHANLEDRGVDINLKWSVTTINSPKLVKTKIVGNQATISNYTSNKYSFSFNYTKIINNANKVSINVPVLNEVSASSSYKVPIRIYNYSSKDINGTLVIDIERGGIFTSQLYPRKLKGKSNIGLMVTIPATNFMGKVPIRFIFQDNTGEILAQVEKHIMFE